MNIRIYILFVCVVIVVVSCNSTKNIPQGEYLLKSYKINVDNKDISRSQLDPYIQQKPNKKMLGTRFHLWLYNSSKLDKTNRWNEWLRKNGEEPVIWEQNRTDKTVEQLGLFLAKKGYFYSNVTDTVVMRKKKATVTYDVKTGLPYTVRKIDYIIPDPTIARLILADTINSLIKSGILVDEDIFNAERNRIENNLKNKGYYSFAKDFISFKVYRNEINKKTDIELIIKPHTDITGDNQVVEAPYPLYKISSVTLNASLSEKNMMETSNMRGSVPDTLKRDGVTFIMPKHFPVKASTIKSSISIFPDSLYRLSSVNQTYQKLNGLRNFKLITVDFFEIPGQTTPLREMDCTISLLPFLRQSISMEVVATYSEGNYGGEGTFQFQNKSLLGHAEIFDLKLRWLMEAVKGEGSDFKEKMEYEIEASVNVPKFLFPFPTYRFIPKHNPKTIFSILYNYQQYPDYYVRTVFSTSFGYNWRSSDVNSHFIRPLDIHFVQLPSQYLSSNFRSTLDRYPYLKNSYQSHMVASNSYTFVRDMSFINRNKFYYIRTNIESAGLLLNAIYSSSNNEEKPYSIFGNEFSQFIKSDIELRYFHTIKGNNRVVTRAFVGVGWPYGNSEKNVTNEITGVSKSVASMPFEKKYYAGGANSMRGWRLRSLGPGSFKDTISLTSYPNNSGDIKIETNLEYRFKMVWLIDGALFMDAGNVWDSRRDSDRPGADFNINRFYREIAMNGGLGFRFDFTYVILRTDLGMKMRDPIGEGRWAFSPKPDGSKRVSWDDFCLNITIGFPFF